jgi:hypothetical protein
MRFFFLLIFLVPATVGSAELTYITVDRINGHYIMHSEVWFDAEVEQMYGVLLDYDLSTQFSSVVVEAKNVEADEQGRPQFYSRYQACVLFFCMDFVRNGFLLTEENVFITAISDPETSDFEFSHELWRFKPQDGGTWLSYDVDMQPKFWIPPVIGPYYIKRKLKSGSVDAIDRIEAIAQAWPDVGE